MSLKLSRNERAKLVARWFDLIVDGYPAETASFLREQSDPFANPVGAGLREDLAPILDGVIHDQDPAEVESALDGIVRIRALQDMSPAEAVSFVLILKDVHQEIADDATDDDRSEFNTRVDGMLLTAFNVYSRCREQMYDIRVKEIRNRSLKVMERLNSWREERAGGPPSNA
jgi:RsbT co-antagonist protein rsbRD N-terminal domain